MSAPPVIPSLLSRTPELAIQDLAVKLDLSQAESIYHDQIDSISAQFTAANYLAVAQIFLQKNCLLNERQLNFSNIKPRLLGHFGTTAGITLAYTHVNALIARQEKQNPKNKDDYLFVLGPGHGAPALLGELFIEETIQHFNSEKYDNTTDGLSKFIKNFSWPGGNPSHVNSETPGAIHEGGELGYALAVAYGSVFDSPNLVTVVIVGDGESESGPTATAWNSHRYLDPKESGAVLPILHVNSFKISERTIAGTMDTTELALLYSGLGYQVRFVDYIDEGEVKMGGQDPADRTIHLNFATSLDWAMSEIRQIQEAARNGKSIEKPRWPMLILRTKKGWTGPLHDTKGVQLLNSYKSHQVPLAKAKTDPKELALLQEWLQSYKPDQLFQKDGTSVFTSIVTDCLPRDVNRRLGMSKHAYANYEPLKLGDWKEFAIKQGEQTSEMKSIGAYLKDTIERNPHSLRIFSPDELESNKLDAVFDVTTRNFQPDPISAHKGGRVIEMLSEHTLQGFAQGYTLTGRHAIFPSYEAFLPIISSMLIQYAKFHKMAQGTNWRRDVASLTYIITSSWSEQMHNGASHQSTAFISTVLSLPVNLARVYFPPDANCSLSVIAHCLRSKNYVNLIIGAKLPTVNWLNVVEAEQHCIAGASIWKTYSIDSGINPDVVLCCIGTPQTFEVIAAAALLKKEFGHNLRVRVVNVVDLLIFAPTGDHPHALDESAFNSLFPPRCPVVINYHGSPSQLTALLFNRPHSIGRARFEVCGFSEQGTTTTPFMMMVLNGCDRYSIAIHALRKVIHNATQNIEHHSDRHRIGKVVTQGHLKISQFQHRIEQCRRHAIETQEDFPEIYETPTFD